MDWSGGWYRLEWSGSGYGLVKGYCERGREPQGFIICSENLEKLNN
jgi:hypothetical protein